MLRKVVDKVIVRVAEAEGRGQSLSNNANIFTRRLILRGTTTVLDNVLWVKFAFSGARVQTMAVHKALPPQNSGPSSWTSPDRMMFEVLQCWKPKHEQRSKKTPLENRT